MGSGEEVNTSPRRHDASARAVALISFLEYCWKACAVPERYRPMLESHRFLQRLVDHMISGRARALVSSRLGSKSQEQSKRESGKCTSGEGISRDPRPVGDRGFTAQCAKNVVELLSARGQVSTNFLPPTVSSFCNQGSGIFQDVLTRQAPQGLHATLET